MHSRRLDPLRSQHTRLVVRTAVAVLLGATVVTLVAESSAGASPPASTALTRTAPVASGAAGRGWIRFGHFAPSQGAVQVRIDGTVVTSDARFETVTPYQSVPDGSNTVTITDLSKPSIQLTTTVAITTGEDVTVVALQDTDGIVLHTFQDNLSAAPTGDAKVRVIDTSPSVSSLSVRLAPASASGTATKDASVTAARPTTAQIDKIAYGDASPYVDVLAGSYNVTVTNESGQQILVGKDWPVTAGTVASLVVIQSTTKPTLEVLRDAAGSASTPVGGMATGFGGMAGLPSSHGNLGLDATVALAAFVGISWVARRRHQGLQEAPASAPGAVVRAAHARGRRRSLAVAAAAAMVVVIAGCGPSTQARSSRPAPARHPVIPTGAASVTTTVPAVTSSEINLSANGTAPMTKPVPTALAIPSIGVHTSLVELGRNANGTAQVPATTAVAGWYADGPAPGQAGPAVILGHVDSYKGPGVFFDLKDLAAGATIDVTEGTSTLAFTVQSVATYVKTAFPTQAVFGPVPDRALRLVTCGGPFDYATGHYDDNVVAYATETSS